MGKVIDLKTFKTKKALEKIDFSFHSSVIAEVMSDPRYKFLLSEEDAAYIVNRDHSLYKVGEFLSEYLFKKTTKKEDKNVKNTGNLRNSQTNQNESNTRR